MSYIFGSIWDRRNRNALNELSKSIEYQGKSIQDLVAKGQLTPDQYARLVSIINGNISKGEVSVFDIDKNKGKLDQSYMSDEFLQQIVGNAPISVVPADKSITQEKMAFPAVVGVPSKNLYNKDTSQLDKALSSSGEIVNGVGYFASDFISVSPETSYALTSSASAVAVYFYDENKNFLSQISNPNVFETPISALYIRIRARIADVNTTQLEKGNARTDYTPYGNFITTQHIPDNAITKDKLSGNIPLGKIEGASVGKNLFNKDDLLSGQWQSSDGSLRTGDGLYVTRGYIELEVGETYNLRYPDHLAFFNEDGSYNSGRLRNDSNTFVAPAKYMRLTSRDGEKDTQQLEKGSNFTGYERFGYNLSELLISQPETRKPTPFLRLRNAVESWYAGEKFPVGFFGDSQTDGNGTTGFKGHHNTDFGNDGGGFYGSVDYHAPNAYPKKLEDFIQKETGNPNARIYNMGYSGHSLYLMLSKRDDLFSHVYSDTKMVGISMGTNDRNLEINRTRLEKRFKRDLIEYVEWFYSKNIQPFILTSQASVEPDTLYESQQVNQLQNKKSEITHAVINRIKKEVAKEYDLELIDVSKFGELFLTHSNIPATEIINDKLHFNDAGHLAEAGYIFTKMFDRVVEVVDDEVLSFTNQTMRSEVAHEHTTLLNSIDNGFKVIVDYTKDNTDDMLILDFWVLIKGKSTFTLKSFVKNTNETYVVLNGENIKINEQEQTLSNEIDIGLHNFQVFTGNSSVVDFKGFKLIQNNY